MPRASTTHAATMGARGRTGEAANPRGMNRTAAPAHRRRKPNLRGSAVPPAAGSASAKSSEEALGETVLLLENRFFRPGGIRVGTMDQMMFRPGLAPDHHSPPPAFRRTSRQVVIPYSKGRPYRKEIGVGKLSETTSEKREDTRMKLVGMLGGDAEVAREKNYVSLKKEMVARFPRRQIGSGRSPQGRREGGRRTKLVNGKETRGRGVRPGRPRSRHNWHRLAIEKSAGTIWGRSACSVRPEDLTSTNFL